MKEHTHEKSNVKQKGNPLPEVQKQKERTKRKQQRIRMIVSIFLLLALAAGAVLLVVRQVRLKKAADGYDGLKEAVKERDKETGEESNVEAEEPEVIPYEGIPEVDFEALRETNTDICAWITIPGTAIEYPVLRNEKTEALYDDYYLNHTAERAEGLPGALYMQPCNSKDFTDFNTVIYGHNMRSGLMFHDLEKYEDEAFLEEHPYVYIVTPEQILVYEIFAAVQYDNRHIPVYFDFAKEEERQAFLDSLKENRHENDRWREGVSVTPDDRMITLSTCVTRQYEYRWLVEAVLVDEYENR